MHAWLPELAFFDDREPHSAALNMAIDEVLLSTIESPVLRVYRWERPAVSFGYFERWEPIHAAHPDREPVRRWTGGGVVLHGEDWTYSLLVPTGDLPAPRHSYAMIHGALCRALNDAGIAATAAHESAAKISQACFENPVLDDVLVKSRKVAGAAQRRTRLGLIHQGSVQGLALRPDFIAIFASYLARISRPESFDVLAGARKIASEKYGTAAWLERRR